MTTAAETIRDAITTAAITSYPGEHTSEDIRRVCVHYPVHTGRLGPRGSVGVRTYHGRDGSTSHHLWGDCDGYGLQVCRSFPSLEEAAAEVGRIVAGRGLELYR